jgi:RNA polymerase sigma-70 factor (ECF subfamily)
MVMGVLPSAHDGVIDEDGGLIEACRRGCGVSHRSLYQKYAGKVYGFARRFLGDEQHAEDVVQEVFLRVFRKLIDFRGESRFSTWLFRITVNSCKNKRRSLSRAERFDGDRFRQDRRDEEEPPEELLADRALGDRIDQALGLLADEQRSVLLLKAVDELSYREIGARSGQSEAQVRGKLYRARKAFRAALERLGSPIDVPMGEEEVAGKM